MSPLKIKGYILPFVLGKIDYLSKQNDLLNHTSKNLISNPQWMTWKKIQSNILKLRAVNLNINDLTRLKNSISVSKSLDDRLRTSNAITHPSQSYTCVDEAITNEVVTLFNDYDLFTEEGYPLLILKNVSACSNSTNLNSADIVFYKNASVRTELTRWLVDFNDTILQFEMNNPLEISPYQYLSDMRRWFLAIAPFSSGNKNIIEAVLLSATRRLNLPPLVQGINEPILLSVEKNRGQILKQMQTSLVTLESCLYEVKTNLVSPECSVIELEN
jgi:hypothetical protein